MPWASDRAGAADQRSCVQRCVSIPHEPHPPRKDGQRSPVKLQSQERFCHTFKDGAETFVWCFIVRTARFFTTLLHPTLRVSNRLDGPAGTPNPRTVPLNLLHWGSGPSCLIILLVQLLAQAGSFASPSRDCRLGPAHAGGRSSRFAR